MRNRFFLLLLTISFIEISFNRQEKEFHKNPPFKLSLRLLEQNKLINQPAKIKSLEF